MNMLESSISSRQKDFTDFFRTITFRNQKEMDAVLGTINDSGFLKELKESTEKFNADLAVLFSTLCE